MTVAGNLAFQPGAFYLVQVNPATIAFFVRIAQIAASDVSANARRSRDPLFRYLASRLVA
jgi:hypothetical protein